MQPLVTRLLPLALCTPVALAGDVWDVGGPGADYPDLATAVAAVADGDTLRVAGGTYGFFQVNAKGLCIVAADPLAAPVHVDGTIRVRNTLPGQHVLLSGLTAAGDHGDGLVVQDCQGPVRVQDCGFTGDHGYTLFSDPFFHPSAWDAVRVLGSDDVAFTACTMQGGAGGGVGDWDLEGPPGDGGSGLAAWTSSVALDGCVATGGFGGGCWDDAEWGGGRGGAGVFLNGAQAAVRGCTLVGADGGHGCDAGGLNFGGPGGVGGSGLWAVNGAHVLTLDDTYAFGAGGTAGVGSTSPDGPDGQPVALFQATQDPRVGSARGFTVPALVSEGQAVAFEYAGQPGDDVWLALSLTAGHQLNPAWNGALLLGSPWISQRRPMGVLGPSGTTTFFIPAPQAPALGSTTWYLQALFIEPGTGLFLSPTRVLVSLDGGL